MIMDFPFLLSVLLLPSVSWSFWWFWRSFWVSGRLVEAGGLRGGGVLGGGVVVRLLFLGTALGFEVVF